LSGSACRFILDGTFPPLKSKSLEIQEFWLAPCRRAEGDAEEVEGAPLYSGRGGEEGGGLIAAEAQVLRVRQARWRSNDRKLQTG